MQRAWPRLLLACLVMACSADTGAPSADSLPAHIIVIAGDAQLGDTGDTLDVPVRFQVTDARARPLPDVLVHFEMIAGDASVPESERRTDADGIVETPWIMGRQNGVQLLLALVDSGVYTSASAATCLPGDCYPEERLEGPLSDASLLELATYDSSGQTVHPDVARGHGLARRFWLAITPFPGGDLVKENPSIFSSSDTREWSVPAGVTNPLALPSATTGYLSDPDIVYNTSDQRLWMFFRAYATQNIISVMRSNDGSHWDQPTIVVSVPSHQLVSPAVVRGSPSAPWVMWSVNAGTQGCTAPTTRVERRTSTDGLNWSSATVTDLAQPGQVIWHIDVQWLPARHEYWALYNTFPIGSNCSTHSLYIARSADGVHWTVSPSPIARSGLTEAFADIIYRSTFMVDSKARRMTLWISGARYVEGAGYVWRTASVATTPAELLAIAAVPAPAFTATPYRWLPPPEP